MGIAATSQVATAPAITSCSFFETQLAEADIRQTTSKRKFARPQLNSHLFRAADRMLP